MKTKSFNQLFFIIILISLLIFIIPTSLAQDKIEYSQVDTVKICNSPQPKTFISKVITSEIKSEYDTELITDINIYNLSNETFLQSIRDTSIFNSFGGEVDYLDINLDGYLDIDINLGYFNLVPSHSFWLFNSKDNKFYYSRDFSQLNDYSVDAEKKIIKSGEQSLSGSGGYSKKYKIENDSLILIETSYSDYYNSGKSELVNGELKTVERTSQEWETDRNNNQLIVLNKYKLIEDSLLIIEKNWLIEFKEKIEHSVYYDDIYDCSYLGYCLKYVKKEVYSYEKNKNGELIKNTEKYQVINDEWVKVDEFAE